MKISQAKSGWLGSVGSSRSRATYLTYRTAFSKFMDALGKHAITINSDLSRMKETHIGVFADLLKKSSPTTEKVYLTAVRRFYRYCNAEEWSAFNMDRVDEIVSTRSRKLKSRYPVYPEQEIAEVLNKIATIPLSPTRSTRLRELRDIALVLTLADTGLRIHEAMLLKRGDVGKETIIMIGKGDKQGKVFLTKRSRRAIEQYLRARSEMDGASGKPLESLPVFSRHDKSAGKKIMGMTPKAGRDAVEKRVEQVLGTSESGVTPHKFRHAFVTRVLKDSHGNLKLAQELARHSSIQITERYAHLTEDELLIGHKRTFEKE